MLNIVHDPTCSEKSENISILHLTEYGTDTHAWTTQTFQELSTFLPSACILTCLEILLITKTVKSIFVFETQKVTCSSLMISVAVVQCRLLSKKLLY